MTLTAGHNLFHLAIVALYGLGSMLILMPLLIKALKKWDVLAHVTDRSSHANAKPLGGGLAFTSIIVAIGGLALLEFQPQNSLFLAVLLLASIPVAAIGFWDDIKERPAWQRLGVQAVAVAVALIFLPQLFDIVPLWLEKIILFFAWVWFVNLYNFMDGLDGLAASEGVFLGIFIAILVPALAPLAILISASLLGFLVFNWQPAKVFMGDVGSTFLGFVLGGLLLVGVEWDTWNLVYPLFTLTLVFSGDTTYTLFKLLKHGKKPWVPHREFWFHRAAIAGCSHAKVVRGIAILNAGLGVIALAGFYLNLGVMSIVAGLIWVWLGALNVQKHEKRLKKSNK